MNKLDIRIIQPIDWLRFNNSFIARKGLLYRKPEPNYDAWLLVRGQNRLAFDCLAFFDRFPNVKKRIVKLRKMMNVRVKDSYTY